jgi:teichuronic acid biosynthesis glycosyltransferase TuaC
MNVLVFTTLYPNNEWPTQGVFIKERMLQVSKLGNCNIKVVAPVPYYPALKMGWRWKFSQVPYFERRDGVEIYHPRFFMTPKIGMLLYGWMMFISVLATIRRIQKNFDFDLIDAHYVYPDGFAAVQLGRFFKKPVIISARGSDINLFKTFPLIRKLLQYVLRRADAVIAVSQALKAAIAELEIPERKVVVIPNGVDLDKFFPMSKESSRRLLGLPNTKLILSVGNLTENKGFELVIKAFAHVLKDPSLRDAKLVIVGEGPSRSTLESLISKRNLHDHVSLVGTVPHDKLHLWYSAADVFCLASRREGWPNVVLEALSCGTPVIATPVGGIPEIIQSDKLGFLTEREETKFASAILDAMRKNWQAEAIRDYAKQHTWHRSAIMIRSLFESLSATQADATHLPPVR